jgi:hypothetical protein
LRLEAGGWRLEAGGWENRPSPQSPEPLASSL